MYIKLHQVKINNGIPFKLKRQGILELNDGYGSYVCEYGHVHDYSKKDIDKIMKNKDKKTYVSAEELMNELEKGE